MQFFRIIFFQMLLFPIAIYAQSNVDGYNVKNNLAISGYDPVSYFEGSPIKGNQKIQYTYSGVKYYFSNMDNLEKFKKAPNNFKPQYGGWCAYAMGNDGSKVKIDPETFRITQGKLYLFYNFAFTNTLEYWNENELKLKSDADNYWSKIIAK